MITFAKGNPNITSLTISHGALFLFSSPVSSQEHSFNIGNKTNMLENLGGCDL